MATLGWIWANAWWLLPVAAYAAAVLAAYVWLGRSAAIAVATAGVAHIAFMSGGRQERATRDAHARDVMQRREAAYDEIDNRGTDADDAADRLRKHDY